MSSILVTGGAGFIGREVCHELVSRGHRVRVLDSLIDQVHGADQPVDLRGVELRRGDVRDRAAVEAALQGVDAVVHLAAEVGVGQSMYEIARYVGSNDLGTAVLLEAMIDRPVQRIVVASSMSVYGEGRYETADGRRVADARRSARQVAEGRWELTTPEGEALHPVPTDEAKPVDLASIYALTKYVQEQAVLVFGRAYRRDAVALRLFNVFGPGQALGNPYTGVLANFASRIASGQAPTIFEDGAQQRDFVHVRDVARAFRLAVETPGLRDVTLNIGSGRAYAIDEVARMVARAMDRQDLAPEIMHKARAGDIRNCFADIGRARALLGFAPAQVLEESLGELAAWVASQKVVDRNAEMRRQLEARGLVA
ncbi:NAD-dependent epimerase/dehydratase family protein [Falsiroseomonas selenitidurans]|uniref:SDR family NAD(P)-dependent oxidoreductase n=1 Tax=Falsiroseomonas selenitidurans TaxID=2716335 RepID=A0ABX1E6H0_9PROT|nr:SDR family NAD(P)-dependent oxidoreductase [Falsiroseomonas selenitidurans]NKC30535.1 SDR family NAD(P)-dependent oxidoreductase [Falsiroseomonas selenitidurans]